MSSNFYFKDYDRIKQIKDDYENYLITEDQIAPEDKILLDRLYEAEERLLQDESYMFERKIEDYKQRMKDAISFLKSKITGQ